MLNFLLFTQVIVDKEQGLQGECGFILSKDTKSYDLSVPIFHILEAKRNDLEEGIRQCSAQLVGAKKYNEKKGYKWKNCWAVLQQEMFGNS